MESISYLKSNLGLVFIKVLFFKKYEIPSNEQLGAKKNAHCSGHFNYH